MRDMNLNELKELLRGCGVVGAGGAGFPAYAKLDTRITTIILNCAECDPLMKLHRQVLERHAREILSALQIVLRAVQADEAIIAIKPSYKKAVEAVKAELSDFPFCRIGFLPEVYPAGDEVVAIYEVTGKVVPAGRLPIEVGVAVFNVETMLNAYAAIKSGMPVVDKYITVTGAVRSPVTLKAPIGTEVSKLVELAGGATVENPALIAGGPMMGELIPPTGVVTKTTNAVLVLPEDHYVVRRKQCNPSIEIKRAMAACSQCRMCTDLCPRYLLGHPVEPHIFMRSASSGSTKDIGPYLNTYFCSLCGLCDMYSCFQLLSPRALMNTCKTGLIKHGVAAPKAQTAPVHGQREGRYIPMTRLISRLGLSEYDHPAPLSDVQVSTGLVRLMLQQHKGALAVPAVREGEKVERGQLVAGVESSKLGCPVHSPIDGCVRRITGEYILIEK